MALCVLPWTVSGCAASSHDPHLRATPTAPARGTVRLALIEQANPQHVFLERLDQDIHEAQTQETAFAGTPTALPQAKLVLSAAASLPRVHRRRNQQARRLLELQIEILSNLETRLQRADTQRLESVRTRLNADAEQNYRSRVDAIDDQADAAEDGTAAQNRDALVNLNAQIHALTVDVQPPPTAPEGYWQSRLVARRAAYDALEAQRSTRIAQLLTERDKRRGDLRTLLQAEADASYTAALASSQTHRAAVLTATQRRLQAQFADIMASAKSLDAASGAGGEAVALHPGQVRSEENPLPPSTNAFLDKREDLSALLRERSRIEEQILRQSMQTITEVARIHHVTVIGYGPAQGVPDITGNVLKWVRADRWG